jgi:hypothetical protein
MMSDLRLGISIALLPFWCLDAKGGEVVLLGFALGWLFGYLVICPICSVNCLWLICVELWFYYCNRLVVLNFVLLV